ncbi:MAG: bifunctional methylenetetrahydrofolate dehydrogenase/methenyltetrahydrofolate cyclohydrolase FolD [Christensenellaceae bacterium]|nr:bifunctional methylenetetrahydrofolate dehydrogenase/methenyltetrahydrofolate cyclohydrolase FolD [Christensenellaceae bacterium]
MSAQIVSGKELSAKIREQLKERIVKIREEKGFTPGLAVILVGDDPASHVYVNNKERSCIEIGMKSEVVRMPAETTQDELDKVIDEYNARSDIHGLLVQFPLPKHLSQEHVLARIHPHKDVDGLTVQNSGALLSGLPGLVSCTPKGVIALIKSTGEEIAGKKTVVIGRSNLVGKPVSVLLLNENATVTMCHSRTKDLPSVCREADILVAAIGRPEFVTGDFIKPGAIVIDVGTSRVDGKLKGDVKFDEACEKAAYITPVPGGVGPMTITMLLENTIDAAEMFAE